MTPLVSVIVPNFNYARFLRACLDSALALEYEPKEIIVVDDGSTDDSRAVIEEYERAGKVTAIFKENGGQPDAVNVGFSRARGDLIYVLDSDDVVFPHMLKHVLALWTPRTSKVQFSLESINERGAPLHSVFPNYHHTRTPEDLRESVLKTGEYQSPPTSGNVYARSYLERILPIEKERFRFSDGPMNAVAPLYGDVASIPSPLGQYRMHTANAWGRNSFNPRTYTTAVRHNMALEAFVVEHSQKLGMPVGPQPANHGPWALQYRMASACLNPDEHPIAESPADVAKLGVAAVHESTSLTAAQKAVMVSWFTLMALGPRRIQEELTKVRFLPAYRAPILGKTLQWLGALRAEH